MGTRVPPEKGLTKLVYPHVNLPRFTQSAEQIPILQKSQKESAYLIPLTVSSELAQGPIAKLLNLVGPHSE